MLRVRAHAPRAKRMGMCKARASAGGMWGAHLRAREPRGSGLLEVVFMLASTLPRTSGCSETIESERNPPETGWDGLLGMLPGRGAVVSDRYLDLRRTSRRPRKRFAKILQQML